LCLPHLYLITSICRSSICRCRSSSITCRLWLQYDLLLHCCCSWLQYYLLFVAPGCCSCICRLWFLESSSIDQLTPVVVVPVAPVGVDRLQWVSIDSSGCRSTPVGVDRLQWVSIDSSVPVAPPVAVVSINRLQWWLSCRLIDSSRSTPVAPVVVVSIDSSGCRSSDSSG